MSYCWRNDKTRASEDNERTWPKLRHPSMEEKPLEDTVQFPLSRLNVESHQNSSVEINFTETLDEIDYPRLGDNSSRKKSNFSNRDEITVVCNLAERGGRKLRIPRSTDLIRVNLHKALQKQNWPMALISNHQAKITLDICKLNVNMSMATPVAKWLLNKSRRRIMHIGGKKIKPSRLKALILYERMMKKQANINVHQGIQQVMLIPESRDDISALNFEGLRINVVPSEETELTGKMSALTCFGTDYREPTTSYIEDNVIFRPDLHEQMENMSIEIRSDSRISDEENDLPNICNVEFIDAETMEATKNLKICEETGELVNNIYIKEEPSGLKFTKKFREYCTNTVTGNLNSHLENFLAEVSRLQKKMYQKDSVKGKSKRRYYAGIREVQKHIELKKMKFVVIAPDLERVEIEGGLDDAISKLLGTCKRYEVPYCFGLGRRKLGYYTHGNGFVSCIGITNYSGAEDKLINLLREVIEVRNDYSRLMSREPKTIDVEKLLPREELLLSELINAYLKIIASMS